MSFMDILRAEYRLVYNDVFRRKSVLLTLILYPYIFTAFTLFIGYSAGTPSDFIQRVGVDPALYLITASYMLTSVLASLDDLLWKPLFDTYTGTVIYILASPVNRLKLYAAIPFPRLTLLVLMGFTSIIPVYLFYFGLNGVLLGLIIMGVITLACLIMIPFAIFVASSVHRVGESWRILNIVRPLVIIFLGVYYPRIYMPLGAYIVSSLIPASHIVEIAQRILIGMQSGLFTLFSIAVTLAIIYVPIGQFSLRSWERKKVKEGVKTL
ncbi:MAG: ABC transporter permease [Desulfurococcaceae archaeon]